MNEFESFVEKVKGLIPGVQVYTDLPERQQGSCWLDIKKPPKTITIEWRSNRGFGFYATDAGYGEGPVEIITSMDKALEKVLSILQS